MSKGTENLREAIVVRGDEETEEEFRIRWSHGLARLDLAAELGGAAAPDLVARLRAPQDNAFGKPCKPFCPPILLAAADAIEALEGSCGVPSQGELLSLGTRLLGFYGVGPAGPDGRPEFGHRLTWTDAIRIEAAGRICALAPEVGALLGVAVPDGLPPPAR